VAWLTRAALTKLTKEFWEPFTAPASACPEKTRPNKARAEAKRTYKKLFRMISLNFEVNVILTY
jgi:hypothetical protein